MHFKLEVTKELKHSEPDQEKKSQLVIDIETVKAFGPDFFERLADQVTKRFPPVEKARTYVLNDNSETVVAYTEDWRQWQTSRGHHPVQRYERDNLDLSIDVFRPSNSRHRIRITVSGDQNIFEVVDSIMRYEEGDFTGWYDDFREAMMANDQLAPYIQPLIKPATPTESSEGEDAASRPLQQMKSKLGESCSPNAIADVKRYLSNLPPEPTGKTKSTASLIMQVAESTKPHYKKTVNKRAAAKALLDVLQGTTSIIDRRHEAALKEGRLGELAQRHIDLDLYLNRGKPRDSQKR